MIEQKELMNITLHIIEEDNKRKEELTKVIEEMTEIIVGVGRLMK